MRDMTCGRARRLAWDDPGEFVLPVEQARARAHLARCPACQRFLSAMRLFRRMVATARGTETAPAPLRERLLGEINAAHQRHTDHRRHRRIGLGLAAAVALAILGTRLLSTGASDPIRQIARRETALLAQSGIESSDAHVVHGWLAERVPYSVHVPEFLDARLTGAAVTIVGGRPSAVIRFQVGERHIAYVIAPDQAVDADAVLRPDRFRGLSIVSWRTPGLLHVWIGQLPPEQLASLAGRCAEQARAAAVVGAASRRAPIRA